MPGLTAVELRVLEIRQHVERLSERLHGILPAGNAKLTALDRLDDVLTCALAAIVQSGG